MNRSRCFREQRRKAIFAPRREPRTRDKAGGRAPAQRCAACRSAIFHKGRSRRSGQISSRRRCGRDRLSGGHGHGSTRCVHDKHQSEQARNGYGDCNLHASSHCHPAPLVHGAGLRATRNHLYNVAHTLPLCLRARSAKKPGGARSAVHCSNPSTDSPMRRHEHAGIVNLDQIASVLQRATAADYFCRIGSHQFQQRNGYSITSSARASTVGGTSSPSALAVLRLTTIS